nr:unnamed protein product [Spirometra erinaceieuropaei]
MEALLRSFEWCLIIGLYCLLFLNAENVTSESPRCAAGFFKLGTSCFLLYNGTGKGFTWNEARQECKSLAPGADLARITDPATQDRIAFFTTALNVERIQAEGEFQAAVEAEEMRPLEQEAHSPGVSDSPPNPFSETGREISYYFTALLPFVSQSAWIGLRTRRNASDGAATGVFEWVSIADQTNESAQQAPAIGFANWAANRYLKASGHSADVQ